MKKIPKNKAFKPRKDGLCGQRNEVQMTAVQIIDSLFLLLIINYNNYLILEGLIIQFQLISVFC